MKSRHAGLGARIAAFAWDYLLILGWLVAVVIFSISLFAVAPSAASRIFGNPVTGQMAGFVLVTLPVALYFTLSESSPRQATWGKRKRHLCVTCVDGAPLSFGRALARATLKFLPWELAHFCVWRFLLQPEQASSPMLNALMWLVWLLVGANIVSVLASNARQTLYDRLARTVVIRPE